MKETKYYVNPEKKTVVCVITILDDCFGVKIHRFEGKAKCSPEDVFDENIGREIAQNRAFIKMKTHFLNQKRSTHQDISNRIEELLKYERRIYFGILRDEGEIKTIKARICELATSK